MTRAYICDACKHAIPLNGEDPCPIGGQGGDEMITVGIIEQRHYCSAMKDRIDAFHAARDKAHDHAVETFKEEMAKARRLLGDV